MTLLRLPYCCVNLTGDRSYTVQADHYDRLKDAFDTGEKGSIELELFEHPAGRSLVRLEEIVDLGFYPQEWIDARWEQKQQARLDGEDN